MNELSELNDFLCEQQNDEFYDWDYNNPDDDIYWFWSEFEEKII